MFRRKVRHSGSELPEAPDPLCPDEPEVALDPHRSRSTSELLAGDEVACRRRSGSGLFPGHSGLSVSHDSVFTAEQRSSRSSCEELHIAKSSSSLSIQQLVLPGVKAELVAAVRRRGRVRGDTSEEDEDQGLPRSPCTSPTTADVLLEKENPTKSHSTCSDGSLLSMGSSEMDEDSFGQTSGHSSKLSMHDKKTAYYDNDMELDMGLSGVPLSHSAARHKMSVKPKRTHGAPRRRRVQQLSATSPLPATPEVNEEASGRSISPEPKEFSAAFSTSDDILALHRSSGPPVASSYRIPLETQLKSASLPPGLALSERETFVKLTRSSSSATTQRFSRPTSDSEQDDQRGMCSTVGEEEEDEINKEKEDKVTFFGRLLSRRSGKKKKERFEEFEQTSMKLPASDIIPKRIDNRGRYANEDAIEYVHTDHEVVKPYGAKVGGGTRVKASARQRVEPINIPASPEISHKAYNDISLDVEQEVLDFPFQPQSHSKEFKQIPRLPGLGPLQHNIMNLGIRDFDYEERECLSLIHANNERKPNNLLSVKKSRSFRGDLDYVLPKSQSPNAPLEIDAHIDYDDECRHDNISEDAVDARLVEVTLSHSSPTENVYLDSLEDANASSESVAFEEVNLIEEIMDEQKTVHTTQEEKSSFEQGKHFTKNNVVIMRSIVKDTTHIGKTHTSFTVTNTKQLMKKSSSLESISSFGEGKGLTSPELSLASKRSSSTESIGSYTHTLEIGKEKSISYTCEASTVTHATVISGDATPSPNHEKHSKHSFRSAAPKYVPNAPHVPEFLRVQLNRVDVKPSNVVLSTNVIFDSDKFNLPKAPTERRHSISKSNESLTKIIKITETSSDTMKKDASTGTQPSLRELRVRTESCTAVPTTHSSQITSESLHASNLLEQENNIVSMDTPKGFVANNQNILDRKSSVTSVSSELASTSPRLSVIDLDSAEVRKEIMKKQLSSNYEDIKIIEKSCTHTEDEVNVSEVVPNKSKGQRKEDDRNASNGIYQNIGDEIEIFIPSKTANKDTSSRRVEDKSAFASVSIGLQNTVMPEVILRKKSLPRESGQQKDEEPELLKVFARRSLKLKDSDTENLLQPAVAKTWEDHSSSDQIIKSRDSDKENEGGDSPREDRKKQHTKEPLTESKLHVETSEIVLRSSTSVVNSRLSNIPSKYQRSHSTGLENGGMNENTSVTFRKDSGGSPEKRQRNRTVPESPGSSMDRAPHRVWAVTRKDKDFDTVTSEEKVVLKPRTSVIKSMESEPSSMDKMQDAVPSAPIIKDDGSIPRFKRIQQRREEWEKRAQQAAKRTVP